jgi:hypothetical protein
VYSLDAIHKYIGYQIPVAFADDSLYRTRGARGAAAAARGAQRLPNGRRRRHSAGLKSCRAVGASAAALARRVQRRRLATPPPGAGPET